MAEYTTHLLAAVGAMSAAIIFMFKFIVGKYAEDAADAKAEKTGLIDLCNGKQQTINGIMLALTSLEVPKDVQDKIDAALAHSDPSKAQV